MRRLDLPLDPDWSRRRFMAGAAALPLLLSLPGRAFAASQIHQLQGSVHINQRPAQRDTPITPGSTIAVSQGATIAFSLDGDAFMLRAGATLEISPANAPAVTGLRLLTGALLAVFDKRRQPVSVSTPVATIGIRGTAIYLDAQPHSLYGCTCYGETDVQIAGAAASERISASHHHPYGIVAGDDKVMTMVHMPLKDHTDDELRLLEAYVGRTPPFDEAS